MWVALLVLLQAIKLAIFENLSTIIKNESLFLYVFGKPMMNVMLTSTKGGKGLVKGCIILVVVKDSWLLSK